ncbi:hypothetical protein ACIOBL_12260 [Paenibacillus taichungensis]|uniref:hypothetical protein n=1 Tax=Paenibacillus taichungensis TaxID=484184 RepID=UPI00381D1F96
MVSLAINVTISFLITLLICFSYSAIVYFTISLTTDWKSVFLKSLKKFSHIIFLMTLTVIYSRWTLVLFFGVLLLALLKIRTKHPGKRKYDESEIKQVFNMWLQQQSTMRIKSYEISIYKGVKVNIRLDIESEIDYSSLSELQNQFPSSININVNKIKKKINSVGQLEKKYHF